MDFALIWARRLKYETMMDIGSKTTSAYSGADWRFVALTLGIAVFTTLLFSYPFFPGLESTFPGFEQADSIEHAWESWWYAKAVTVLRQSPAKLDYIYYPVGAFHPKITACPWAEWTAFPFLLWFDADPLVIQNFHIFTASVLTFLFTSLFCLELTKNRTAAIFSGLIFSLCPTRTAHILNGHITQALTYPFPLLIWLMWRTWSQPTVGRGLALGVVLAIAAMVDLMPLFYFVAPITLFLFATFYFLDSRRFRSAEARRAFSAGLLLAGLILAPLMIPLFIAAFQGDLDWYKLSGADVYSADFLAFVVPPPGHFAVRNWTWLSAFSERIYGYRDSITESVVYVGWGALGFALTGVLANWRSERPVRIWTTLFLLASLLALGSTLRFDGTPVILFNDKVFLPYWIVTRIPLLEWARTPARLSLLSMFAASVLAGYGVKTILEIKNAAWRKTALIVLGSLVLVDSATYTPWPVQNTSVPRFYDEIAADRRSVAILEVPALDFRASKSQMLYQMRHGHPIAGGWRDRRPAAATTKLESLVLALGNTETAKDLPALGIGYVVLHHRFLPSDFLARVQSVLQAVAGAPAFSDDRVTIYRLPGVAEIAPRPL